MNFSLPRYAAGAFLALVAPVLAAQTGSDEAHLETLVCVSDPATGALSEAEVLAMVDSETSRNHSPVRPGVSAITDSAGCANLELAPESYVLSAEHPGYWTSRLTIDPEKSSYYEIALDPIEAAPLEVRVIASDDGTPLEGAHVVMEWGGDRGGPRDVEGLTDLNGRVVFDALPDGAYYLGIAGKRRIKYFQEDLVISSPRAGITRAVETTERFLAHGTVLDQEGSPLQNARVRVGHWRYSTSTDELGEFQVFVRPLEGADLRVSMDGYEPHTSLVEPPDGPALDLGEIRLRPKRD